MKFVFSTSKSKLRVEVQGVGLQNFQGVKDFVWLPLAQLTLIFGPNSAGKSSIADALELLPVLAKIDYGDKRKAVLDCIRSPSLEEGPCKNHFRPANADDTVVAIRTKPAVFFCLITDEALRSNPKKDLKDRSPLSYFINHLTDNEVSVYYVIGEHHTKAIAIEVNAKLLLVVEYFINHQKASPVTRLVDSLDTTYAISQEKQSSR